MCRQRVTVARRAVTGQAHEDRAPVVGAHAALDQAVVLEPCDGAGEGALAEVDVLGEISHAVVAAVGVDEPVEDLELAEPDAVFVVQRLLQGAARLRMPVEVRHSPTGAADTRRLVRVGAGEVAMPRRVADATHSCKCF